MPLRDFIDQERELDRQEWERRLRERKCTGIEPGAIEKALALVLNSPLPTWHTVVMDDED